MHEFIHVSHMIKEDEETFKNFVNEMVLKSDDFLKFINLFDEECNFVSLSFYELDSDEYDYPVFKWSVNFSPSDKNIIRFGGYSKEDLYKVTNTKTKELVVVGNYYEINDHINQKEFEHLTQKDVNELFDSEHYQFDKCKEWIKEIDGFELIFEPDESY